MNIQNDCLPWTTAIEKSWSSKCGSGNKTVSIKWTDRLQNGTLVVLGCWPWQLHYLLVTPGHCQQLHFGAEERDSGNPHLHLKNATIVVTAIAIKYTHNTDDTEIKLMRQNNKISLRRQNNITLSKLHTVDTGVSNCLQLGYKSFCLWKLTQLMLG